MNLALKNKNVCVFALIIGICTITPAFADNSTNTQNATTALNPYQNPIVANTQNNTGITVTTDKTLYNDGDKLTISGTVSDYIPDMPVSVIVRNPVGSVAAIIQVYPETDKTYSTIMTTGGSSLWQNSGTYKVDVQYGSKDTSSETTFQFNGSGASSMISVMTDKTYYVTGDIITIFGTGNPNLTSEQYLEGIPNPVIKKLDSVWIELLDSAGGLIEIKYANMTEDGKYSVQIQTGSAWDNPGLYTVIVDQGKDMESKTKFWFNYNGGSIPSQANSSITIPLSTPITAQPTQNNTVISQTTDAQAIYEKIQKRIENAKRSQYLMQEKHATILNVTTQELSSINEARNNQTIAAEINVVNQTVQTTSINSNVSVQTNNTSPDSLSISVSAPSQTGPKVIIVNLAATTIDVANLKDLGVMYDGALIPPASNIDSILHAKSTDSPSFAIVVTQSGAQILILVPHFSTHIITITNMTKVIPAVPEFGSLVGMIIIISIIGVLTISRKFKFHF